ncbi:hypothetical protein GCM10011391_10370 [Pullulanibacillus camelliae]|uniref:CMP/dCMP-type deaminase domain-containing protein n=1 Tax=Pullulanibacillus camelliae TaxID=1707096 RepID=A0A8J2VMX2_9BACL|nr:hypothetical protein GCM10011391_10370 [Pullulanibacillus camelliae]
MKGLGGLIVKKKHEEYLVNAIELAIDNVKTKGGPFGAVIVQGGRYYCDRSQSSDG